MINVWVNGCFDILHVGHIELLEYAKSLGDKLIVGIDVDQRVKELKGQNRPFNTTKDRKKMLESLRCVDVVTFFKDEGELKKHIKKYNIDIMVVGDDYKDKYVVGSELVKDVFFFKKVGGYSTTSILKSNNKKK